MPNLSAIVALLFVLAIAACVSAPPSSAPRTGAGQSLDPSIWERGLTDRFRMRLDTSETANWRVDSSRGLAPARTIEVVAGRRCEFVVRSAREVMVEIPAMRVRVAVAANVPTRFWFLPTTAGEYDVRVRSGLDAVDGKLVVRLAQDDDAGDRLPVVDEARLAATAALRAELVTVMVEQWRPTGNGDERMCWLIPIPVEELAAMDPLLAVAERVLEPKPTMAIHSEFGLLHTRNGVYRFRFFCEKIAARTHRAMVWPVDARPGTECITLVWPEAVGDRLMYELEWLEQLHAGDAIPAGETSGDPRLR